MSDLRSDRTAENSRAEDFIPRYDSMRARPKDRRPVRLVDGMPAVSVPRQHLLWDFAVHARQVRGRAVPTMLEVQDAADEAGLPHWVVCTYFRQLLRMLGEDVPLHIARGEEYTSPVPRPGESDDGTHPPKLSYARGKPVVSRKVRCLQGEGDPTRRAPSRGALASSKLRSTPRAAKRRGGLAQWSPARTTSTAPPA